MKRVIGFRNRTTGLITRRGQSMNAYGGITPILLDITNGLVPPNTDVVYQGLDTLVDSYKVSHVPGIGEVLGTPGQPPTEIEE